MENADENLKRSFSICIILSFESKSIYTVAYSVMWVVFSLDLGFKAELGW